MVPFRRADSACRHHSTGVHAGDPGMENGGLGNGGRRPTECWWRWGRIELPVQNRVAGNLLQVFPAYFELRLRAPDRRGAPLAIRLTLRPFGIAHRSRRYRIPPCDAFTVRQEETVSALVAT